MKRGTAPRYVYFIQAGEVGPIKIGCSNQPTVRLMQIGEWLPFNLRLLATMPGSFALESALHNMFAADWSHGEWFRPSSALIDFIAAAAAGKPVEIKPNPEAYDGPRRTAIRSKKQWSRRINKAEMAAWGISDWRTYRKITPERRPPDIHVVIERYQRTALAAPTADEEALLWAYLNSLPIPETETKAA